MTNKTEMVSVPRDWLEHACKAVEYLALRADDIGTSNVSVADSLRALLAAPAEDVRAVVDEPVAEVVSKYGDPEAFGERDLVALLDIQSIPYGTKLYRHPQRPVVMPERKPIEPLEFNRTKEDVENEGWNACLDKYARLNPQ
jgi:hypothetical protein